MPWITSAHWSERAGRVMVLVPALIVRGGPVTFSRPNRVATPASASLPLMCVSTSSNVRVCAPISARSIEIVVSPLIVPMVMSNRTSPSKDATEELSGPSCTGLVTIRVASRGTDAVVLAVVADTPSTRRMSSKPAVRR